MSAHHTDDRKIALQAAQWQETLKTASARERAAFVSWLVESRRHVRNFLLVTTLDQELKKIDPARQQDIDALLAQAKTVPCVLPHKEERNLLPSFRLKRYAALAASVALVAIGIVGAAGVLHRSSTYTTAIGEQRSIPLPDGTVIQLNTNSLIKVEFTDQSREVRLLEGEVLFTVRRDSARPFRVNAGNTIIQALGTQFNVYRSTAGTAISVTEGAVRLEPSGIRLSAGEQARVSADLTILKNAVPDVPRAVAWRDRRLVFRNDRLEDIAAEFNRYNSTQQIHVEGNAVRDRRITGIFAADDPQLLVLFLAKDADLSVEKTGNAIVIKPGSAESISRFPKAIR
jgi:transmembrane sensor